MNGCASSFSVVNAEDHSMGGVVEGGIGIGIADDTSPRKVVIDKVQAELSQKYRARDETKQELEFLEKGGNLLDYKLQDVASASFLSTSVADQQNDRLVTNDAKGSSAFVSSSHGDSVEASGEPAMVPSEVNSADNLMYFDAETEFSEGGRSLSHPCRSDVPLEPSLSINEPRKHGDSAALTLPRKAYKRRYRSCPSRDGVRSSTMNVDPADEVLSNQLGPRDVKHLESEGEKQDMKAALPSSLSPVEGCLLKSETSGELLLNDLDRSRCLESVKNFVECSTQPVQPDYTSSSNLLHEKLHQEQQYSAPRSPKGMGCDGLQGIEVMEMKSLSVSDSRLSLTSRRFDDQMTAGFEKTMELDKRAVVLKSDPNALCMIDSGRSHTNETGTPLNNIDSSVSNKCQILSSEASVMDLHKPLTSKKGHEESENLSLFKQEKHRGPQSILKNGVSLQSIEGSAQSILKSSKMLEHVTVEKLCTSHSDVSDPSRKRDDSLLENPNARNETSCSRNGDSVDANYSNPKHSGLSNTNSSVVNQLKTSVCDSKLAENIDENSVLEEAQLIEARRKKFVELSMVTLPTKIQWRSHWGYVLEEMAWLSNDFAQERMWKITAAANTSFKAAVACRMKKETKKNGMDAKIVARTIAKAVLEFWNSVVVQGTDELIQQKNHRNNNPIRAYATRLIVSHKQCNLFYSEDSRVKRDSASDWELPDIPEDNIPYEEQNFYTVVPGAMEAYRASVTSHVAHIERTGSYVQEESEASACDGVVDFESQDHLYNQNVGEARTFDVAEAFESNMSSRCGRKKLKRLKHGHGIGSYEVTSLQHCDVKLVKREPGSLAKRPGGNLNVSFPTKRVRTATRRVISPFSAGPSRSFQLQNKADASSGDTSSLQDEHSTLRAGLVYSNALDADSLRDYEKQALAESAEVSMMPKKKKTKHMSDDYDSRWQADSSFHEEQRSRFRRSSEARLLEANGNGLFGQPMTKKPKVLRQSRDHSFDNQSGMALPSPVASQFSNMQNRNTFVKIHAGRDHARKVKGPKNPTGQAGSGSPWSVFEDQALVVLVHDHGPNWELISDAFNSALYFKCIFRNAGECKERHHALMDRSYCDGADSAEDSGPPQPYPSALPGIPKGSARQLFQRLLGPIEEDTLNSHFEKIITIGQKLLVRRSQDPKQLLQPHSSHSAALSQVFPNNLNRGSILTPLDLCDVVRGPDVFPTGMQVVNTAGSAGTNQGMNNPLVPSSAGSALQGSSNMTPGTSFSSPGFTNSSARDGRHVIPRCGSLSADDQQKIQHYNQMVPGRTVSQATVPALGAAAGNGLRINASGSAMGVMGNGNKSFPMARPGLPGTSTSLVSSATVAPPTVPPNMQAGFVTGHGSSMPRSNDASQLMRPGLGQDSPRQIVSGSGQGVPRPRGVTSPLPIQTAASPVSPYPSNHQTTLPMSPHRPQIQHAYFEGQANRLGKERQLHQRMVLQQPQQQFAANSSVRPVQPKPQHPLPSPIQTGSQPQPPQNLPASLSSVPTSSLLSSPQYQQKHQPAALGVAQNTQSGGNVLANHTGKQQGRQHHLPQSSRHHPQRQQLQAVQQVKVSKGGGTGNVISHPVDSSVTNGITESPIIQPPDKREAGSQLMQNQSLNAGSTLSSMQPTRLSDTLHQQKVYSSQGNSGTKHIQTSKSDNGSQDQASPVAVLAVNDGQQSCSPVVGTTDGILNNQGSTVPLSSNSHDAVSQDGQRPTAVKHDANEQWQQNPSQPGQKQQSQLLQAGNGNLHGRPSDPGLG